MVPNTQSTSRRSQRAARNPAEFLSNEEPYSSHRMTSPKVSMPSFRNAPTLCMSSMAERTATPLKTGWRPNNKYSIVCSRMPRGPGIMVFPPSLPIIHMNGQAQLLLSDLRQVLQRLNN